MRAPTYSLALLYVAACKPDPDPIPEIGPLGDEISAADFAAHLDDIEALSPESAGWRTAGSAGDAAGRAYVTDALEALGWTVREDPIRWGIPLRETANLVAESPGGDPAEGIVLVTAHGDSQALGPGMNDNGSGVAALLTLALALDRWPGELPARVRLVFFAWEEGPGVGSQQYFARLDDAELGQHVAFVNLDMLGSTNGARLLLDPSTGAPDTPLAPGSADLTSAIAAWWDEHALAWEYGDEMGADHTWALDTPIPTAAVYSGSVEVVTEAQAAAYGTIAGQPMDPCFHQACDTVENVDAELAIDLLRAAAAGVEAVGGPVSARDAR